MPLTGSPLSPGFPGGPASPCLPCNNISRRLVSIQYPERCHFYLLFSLIYLHVLRVHPSCHLSPFFQAPPAGQHIDHLASHCLSLALEIFRHLNKTNAVVCTQASIHISYNHAGKTWRSLDSLETLFALLEAKKTQGRSPSPKQRGWLMATVTSMPPLTYMLVGEKGFYNNDMWVMEETAPGVHADLFSRGPRGSNRARLSIITLEIEETDWPH